MPRISSDIFSWNAGFSSEREGSPMISTAPLSASTIRVHQIQGR